MERHLKVDERSLTFEELLEMSRKNPRRTVPFSKDELTFTQQGEFNKLSESRFCKSRKKCFAFNSFRGFFLQMLTRSILWAGKSPRPRF